MAFLFLLIAAVSTTIASSVHQRSFVPAESAALQRTTAAVILHDVGIGSPTLDRRIHPRDTFRVIVGDEEDLSGRFTVSDAGAIDFPLLGTVRAVELTPNELADVLTGRLRDGYLKRPMVRVEFDDTTSVVLVLGEVRAPGRIHIDGPTALLDVLGLAGSPTTGADNDVIVQRKNGERMSVDWRAPSATDVTVFPGDTVFVPEAQLCYVLGEVREPGAYVFRRGMTVADALALAGGVTPLGSDRRLTLIRANGGNHRELGVSLADPLLAGDSLTVGRRVF